MNAPFVRGAALHAVTHQPASPASAASGGMSPCMELEHIVCAAACLDDTLAARWALITMTGDHKTEADARAIAAQAVRDLSDDKKDAA